MEASEIGVFEIDFEQYKIKDPVECVRHRAKISKTTCVARQKKIRQGDHNQGVFYTRVEKYIFSCGGCEEGERYLKEAEDGEKQ